MLLTDTSQPDRSSIVAMAYFSICRPSASNPNSHLDKWVFTAVPLTNDHDQELCKGMIDFAVSTRRKAMSGIAHVFVELVATRHEYKGKGAGGLLLRHIRVVADEERLPIFVETNGAIVKFYEKLGFEIKETMAMPGGLGYEEFILIREPHSEQP